MCADSLYVQRTLRSWFRSSPKCTHSTVLKLKKPHDLARIDLPYLQAELTRQGWRQVRKVTTRLESCLRRTTCV